jgi:predicted ATPase/DNA-binding SARP family transcriptional activator
MTDLRFGVLGPLEVLREGRPVVVPAGRRRAVLACLLVHAGRPVAADVLVEAAWREDLPEDPRAALNTVLSRLRATLGAHAIVSEAGGYALAVGEDAVDAHRFEALRASSRLGEALALWRGPAYDGFADRDFAAAEAQRLDRLRLDATEEHAALLVDAGEHGAAAAELEVLLDEHPFRERAVELLMTALYRAGRQADALARFRSHRGLLRDELGLDPSPSVSRLESRILGHDVPPAPEPGEPSDDTPSWLDTSTAFIGRDATLAHLVAAVAGDRLVTVTGVGGVGKTRLVAEALPALSGRLRMPITVVELAPVLPGRVSTTVADALGLDTRAETARDDLLEYLSITRCLVVLDNCEHLRAEVAGLVDAVARRCPRVRLLATSRHRLGTGSERVVPLAPFPVAGAPTDPAVRLFVDRVSRLRPSFRLTAENAGAVYEACRRLDGLPLALELAASRAATLGVETVLRWSRTAQADGPLRDLRSVVEWSSRLLTEDQRRLLSHLAVFADGFSAVDVATVGVAHGPWGCEREVVGALEELVESSLLVSSGAGAETQFRMLALVRSFAAEQLTRSGEEGQLRLAHAQWARDVVEQAARQWVSGDAAAASRRLARAGPDVKAALRWALAAAHLDVAAPTAGALALCLHWLAGVELGDLVLEVARDCLAEEPDPRLSPGLAAGAMTSAGRGDRQGTRDLAGAALASAPTDPTRLLACMALAVSTFYSGEHEVSVTWLERAESLRELAAGYRVEPHITHALLSCAHDDLEAARRSLSIALTGSEAANAEAARAFALYACGEVEARHDPARGASAFREAAAEADRIGAAHISQVSRLALFAVLVRQGHHEEALGLAVPLLQDVRRAGAWPQVWTTLRIAAELLAAHGRREDSVFLLSAAEAAPTSPPLIGEDVGRYALLSEVLGRHLDGDVIARIRDLAAGMPRSQVVDRARTLLAHLR